MDFCIIYCRNAPLQCWFLFFFSFFLFFNYYSLNTNDFRSERLDLCFATKFSILHFGAAFSKQGRVVT